MIHPLLRCAALALLALTTVEAAAQRLPTLDGAAPASPSVLPSPRGGGDVLYDQTANVGTQNFPSQEFEATRAQFNSQGADDFAVPVGTVWSVTEVSVLGAYRQGEGPATNVDVRFYADAGGRPGSRILSYADLAVDQDLDGDLTVTLSPSAILTEGTYWVSFLVDMDALTAGQWFWTKQATEAPIGAELHWRNPGNGFGLGCTAWQPLNSVCGDDGGFDASFRLSGRAREAFVSFTPSALAESLEAGESSTRMVTVSNEADRPVAYTFAVVSAPFVSGVAPTQGEVPAGGTVEVAVTFAAEPGLRPGVYADTLKMASDLGPVGTVHILPLELTVTAPVAAGEGAAPAAFSLRRAYPNPFASGTTVEVALPEAGTLCVEVYDTLGRRVAVLAGGEHAAGRHRLRWDAQDAASGVYVVRARAGAHVATQSVALVR